MRESAEHLREGVMRYVVINEQSSRADIETALAALTDKAKRACIPSTLREVREDQDERLDLLIDAT